MSEDRSVPTGELGPVRGRLQERLADGGRPLAPDALLAVIESLGVEHQTFEHEAVRTVAESKVARAGLAPRFAGGAHIKNLFLRNRKGRMWVVTCLEDRVLDLKRLGGVLGAGRLSFASPERMMSYLGVTPGAVTPLAVANDRGGRVGSVLDQALFDFEFVNVHPLVNTMTTSVRPSDLRRILGHFEHPPSVMDLGQLEMPAGD